MEGSRVAGGGKVIKGSRVAEGSRVADGSRVTEGGRELLSMCSINTTKATKKTETIVKESQKSAASQAREQLDRLFASNKRRRQ